MTIKRQRLFPTTDDDLITRGEVEQMTALSCSAIYNYSKKGEFPRPVKIGSRTVRWRRGDIKNWREKLERKTEKEY